MKENFPFKTLIWAVVLLLSFIIFKSEVKNLLSNAVEVSILGNTVKVSEKESEELLAAQISFDGKLQELIKHIQNQDTTIFSLNDLIENLKGELDGCSQAQATAGSIDKKLYELNTNRMEIKREPIFSGDFKIIERSSSKLNK